jgi:hypothetical protein
MEYIVHIRQLRWQLQLISEGLREVTRGGGREREPNQTLFQELTYVPSSNHRTKTLQEGDKHTNQQCRNDPLEVTNAAEKEWDQLDTQLAKYDQKSERTSD